MTPVGADVPPPGSHGGDGAVIAAWLGVTPDAVLDLSASLNPFPLDVPALITAHAAAARRYGDPRPLEQEIATLVEADPERVVATNGASEAIALVAQLLGRGRVDDPEFSLYRRHLEIDPTAGLWRSNPHSPSGRLADGDDTAAVWDEAYWQLATGIWTRGDHQRGAFVIGSLTKLLGAPGIRVGWVVTPDADAAARIRRARPEWSVSALAIDVALDALHDLDLCALSSKVAVARGHLTRALTHRGLDVEADAAPWVLVHGVAGMRDELARRGVVVRDCTSFDMPDTVRIAVPDTSGLERLLEALDCTQPRITDPKDP